MKDENIKKLQKELKYLTKEAIDEEVKNYDLVLANNNPDIKNIVNEIYRKRGIDSSKLKQGLFDNLVGNITEFGSLFKNKRSEIKRKMIIELIYMVLILVLLKIPFDLVRDIGFDYLDVLSTNNTYFTIWNILFLILYTITFICTLIILIRNFNKKYRDL